MGCGPRRLLPVGLVLYCLNIGVPSLVNCKPNTHTFALLLISFAGSDELAMNRVPQNTVSPKSSAKGTRMADIQRSIDSSFGGETALCSPACWNRVMVATRRNYHSFRGCAAQNSIGML